MSNSTVFKAVASRVFSLQLGTLGPPSDLSDVRSRCETLLSAQIKPVCHFWVFWAPVATAALDGTQPGGRCGSSALQLLTEGPDAALPNITAHGVTPSLRILNNSNILPPCVYLLGDASAFLHHA